MNDYKEYLLFGVELGLVHDELLKIVNDSRKEFGQDNDNHSVV